MLFILSKDGVEVYTIGENGFATIDSYDFEAQYTQQEVDAFADVANDYSEDVAGTDVNTHGGYNLAFSFSVDEVTPLVNTDFDYYLVPTDVLKEIESDDSGDVLDYIADDDETHIAGEFNDEGVVEFTVPDEDKEKWDDKQFSVVAKVKDEFAIDFGSEISFDGEKSGSTMNKIYNVNVLFESDVYGKGNLPVKWTVISEEEKPADPTKPQWHKRDSVGLDEFFLYKYVSDEYDEELSENDEDVGSFTIENLEEQVLDWALTNKGKPELVFDASKVSYKYVPYASSLYYTEYENLDGEDERLSGLPGKDFLGDKNFKFVTIYVFYDDVEVTALRTIVCHEPTEITSVKVDDAEITFTDGLEIKDAKFYSGKTELDVSEDDVALVFGADTIYRVDEEGKYLDYDEDDTEKENPFPISGLDDGYDDIYDPETGVLAAGNYIVKVNAVVANNSPVSAKYKLADDGVETTFKVTVNKKTLTADLIKITPFTYDTKKKDIVQLSKNDEVNVKIDDPTNPFEDTTKLVVKEGSSVSAISSNTAPYTCEVAIDGTSANYTADGNVKDVKWRILNAEYKDDTKVLAAFNDAGTTIKSNSYFRFQVDLNADDAALLPETSKVTKIGVIFDRKNVLDSIEDANDELLLNNGFEQGGKENADKYGFAIKVTDVNQVIYARPYALLADGTVWYGEVSDYKLIDFAKGALNLRVAGSDQYYNKTGAGYTAKDMIAFTAADGKDAADAAIKASGTTLTDDEKQKVYDRQNAMVKSGYIPSTNQYYLYCQIDQLVAPKDVGLTLEVNKFGIVFDRVGKCANEADAAEKLVVNTTDTDIKVGNYNKNSAVLSQWEYGAKITPNDTVTGLWVRAYVDLGNDLIVYTDPFYIESVSDYYRETFKRENIFNQNDDLVYDDERNVATFSAEEQKTAAEIAALAGVDESKVSILSVGIVADNAIKFNVEDGLEPSKENEKIILGEGLVEGIKAVSAITTYKAQISPATEDSIIFARGYSIDGVSVVVYTGWGPLDNRI